MTSVDGNERDERGERRGREEDGRTEIEEAKGWSGALRKGMGKGTGRVKREVRKREMKGKGEKEKKRKSGATDTVRMEDWAGVRMEVGE